VDGLLRSLGLGMPSSHPWAEGSATCREWVSPNLDLSYAVSQVGYRSPEAPLAVVGHSSRGEMWLMGDGKVVLEQSSPARDC
jgi:hypothetical protein